MYLNYKNLRLNNKTNRFISRNSDDRDWWNCGEIKIYEISGSQEMIYLHALGSVNDLLQAEKWLEGADIGLFSL